MAKSGRQDLNLRPSAPKADALPNCATPRCVPIRSTQAKTCLSYYRLEHIVFMRPSNRICTARRSTRHVVDGEFTPLRVVLPYGHHSTYYHENWLDRIRTCNLSVNSGSHYRCATLHGRIRLSGNHQHCRQIPLPTQYCLLPRI